MLTRPARPISTLHLDDLVLVVAKCPNGLTNFIMQGWLRRILLKQRLVELHDARLGVDEAHHLRPVGVRGHHRPPRAPIQGQLSNARHIILRSFVGGFKWEWRVARSGQDLLVTTPSPIQFSAPVKGRLIYAVIHMSDRLLIQPNSDPRLTPPADLRSRPTPNSQPTKGFPSPWMTRAR